MPSKRVYFFGARKAEGRGDQKELLGGKGAGLAEMTRLGLPVPAGFTITTEVCDQYYRLGKKWPRGLDAEIKKALKRLEHVSGKTLGDPVDPLLVSVRSGAARSMPGMMETILNLGLNDRSVEGLAKGTNNPRFAYDAYRRFITMYGATARGIERALFDEEFQKIKDERTRKRLGLDAETKVLDTQVDEAELRELVHRLKKVYLEHTREHFPQDPWAQLVGSVNAVFGSWMAEKAMTYRRVEKISGLKGTAVNIVQMVFGNMGEDSGTGVCFTRDPNTGENTFYGDFLSNAQGEDVVAGVRTPLKLSELERRMAPVYYQLVKERKLLERAYKDMQDIEFTVERGRLYILQCRSGKRSPQAAFRIAHDMVAERLITREEAVRRISPEDIERLFYPVIDPAVPKADLAKRLLAKGIDAVPGAASGEIVFTAAAAEAAAEAGRRVILVRRETSPEDVGGMHAAQGILTATGGKTSHAAVVARGWAKSCIVGCEELDIDPNAKEMKARGKTLREGELITLDGGTGSVYEGALPLVKPALPPDFHTVMGWADTFRRLRVRANADTPYDAKKAVEMGAEGIGLCRTEHMFFDTEERRFAIQEMILADTAEQRRAALDKLLPFQRDDFAGIFEAMDGKPVTIRLIDPPLHEFVPHDRPKQEELAARLGIDAETVSRRVAQLHEANPMLGHRGCRLCITYPEILDMQIRAIVEAAIRVKRKGIDVRPEIMHPLVMDRRELEILEKRTRAVADPLLKASKLRIPYTVGTMIEVPRAAFLADQIAEVAEFFSFGTNDLTQMSMGLSRDDAGRFLPEYVNAAGAAVFAHDPFQSLALEGVGGLMRHAVEKGRKTQPKLKIGICGEHGGDPRSVRFCHDLKLDYVSCSPYRVPIARLAAAQAVISGKKK
ncbi:MAG TPA: pyruvate, phosphate dikinase [Planctomycetota bacterium]|nr:pyruvate, phosphate dikinase [Planctomycetota bacterium]